MQDNQKLKVRIVPTKIRTGKKVVIYSRVSTGKHSQEESLAYNSLLKPILGGDYIVYNL